MSGNQHHIHRRHRRRGAGDAIGAAAILNRSRGSTWPSLRAESDQFWPLIAS
jgi:hypothetical protein